MYRIEDNIITILYSLLKMEERVIYITSDVSFLLRSSKSNISTNNTNKILPYLPVHVLISNYHISREINTNFHYFLLDIMKQINN